MADYIDELERDIIAGAVATGGDVDIADWVSDLRILTNLAKGI